MKRKLVFTLIGPMLALGLAACGGEAPSGASADTAVSSAQEVTTDEAAATEATAEQEAAPEAAQANEGETDSAEAGTDAGQGEGVSETEAAASSAETAVETATDSEPFTYTPGEGVDDETLAKAKAVVDDFVAHPEKWVIHSTVTYGQYNDGAPLSTDVVYNYEALAVMDYFAQENSNGDYYREYLRGNDTYLVTSAGGTENYYKMTNDLSDTSKVPAEDYSTYEFTHVGTCEIIGKPLQIFRYYKEFSDEEKKEYGLDSRQLYYFLDDSMELLYQYNGAIDEVKTVDSIEAVIPVEMLSYVANVPEAEFKEVSSEEFHDILDKFSKENKF